MGLLATYRQNKTIVRYLLDFPCNSKVHRQQMMPNIRPKALKIESSGIEAGPQSQLLKIFNLLPRGEGELYARLPL